MDYQPLRESTKALLAAAVLELFPKTVLLEGDVDEIGFSYTFHFPRDFTFSQTELDHIEDQMRLMVQQDLPIKQIEMMRENAQTYFEHHRQPVRAEVAGEQGENILPLIQIGPFQDLATPPFVEKTGELKTFVLHGFHTLEENVVKIEGTTFSNKDELKEFLKRYKEGQKRSADTLGPALDYWLEEGTLLPKGEALLHELSEYWRHFLQQEGFQLVWPKEAHLDVIEKKKLTRVASYSVEEGDLLTWKIPEGREEETLISSLHFLEKAVKIFPFETHLFGDQETRYHEMCARDYLGRKKTLSAVWVERESNVIQGQLFASLDNWLKLCIEKRVEKINFESESPNPRP